MQTNYYGVKNVSEAILPLLRPSKSGARIVNVSSRLGQFSNVMKAIVRLTFDKIETLSEKKMEEVMKNFYIDAKQRKSDTWATMYPHYSVSKAFVNAYTRMLARDLADRPAGARIFVNSFCPGYTQTDITAGQGIHNSCWSAERLFDSNHWVPKGFGSSGVHRILLLVRLSFAPRLALTKNKSGGQPHVTPCVEPVRNFREATRFTKLLEYVL